jgi:hypothetical protein
MKGAFVGVMNEQYNSIKIRGINNVRTLNIGRITLPTATTSKN